MTLNDKLATIQTKFKSKKSRFNSFGKYNFRSAEDILEATKPFLLELGVTVTINEEIISVDPLPMMKSTATVSDGNMVRNILERTYPRLAVIIPRHNISQFRRG